MKKLPFILLSCLLYLGLFAQQEPQFNQYMFNRTLINPAAGGSNDAVYAIAFGRDQWIGYKDGDSLNVSPRNFGVSFDMPIYAINSGVGINFMYGALGAEKNIDFRLNYAYQLNINRRHRLSFGLSFSLLSKSIDYSQLIPAEFDPMLGNATEKGMMTDIGFGVQYQANNKFYLGLSANNLLGSSAEIGSPEFDLQRHYYLYSGYDIDVNNDMVLTPGLLVKATSTALTADISAILTYNEKFWGGILVRTSGAAGLMGGIEINGLRLGISYDYTFSPGFATGCRHSIEGFVSYSYAIHPKVVKRSGYNTRNL
jgi:type IX secretion system PorP/SprF family membrane protein